jgi:uncharacterized protein YjbI with pentapeptide repeats
MTDDDYLTILGQGADFWNQWRSNNPTILPNLMMANLGGADLRRMDLRRIDLSWANLSWSNLREVDLRNTNLSEANLRGADLSGANLSGANLSGANLSWANLSGAHLNGADLSRANWGYTTITKLHLNQVTGLDTGRHWGPSSIGIDTIYLSQGKIPEIFLRRAGVPDSFIEHMSHLVVDAIQFYSCFISYSTADQAFAERLHPDLQSKGVRCWFAPEDIKGGRKLHEQIPEAIRLYDKLLLVLSENSMNSEWVKTEIYHARQDEIRTGKRKLFPIGLIDFEEIRKWQAFDADVGKDMAREVREYYIPDFSAWKNHDSYRKALDRLVRDLQAEN